MKILSIHDGHTATACLLENGKILGMASEERFTKKKNQGGFPFHAIEWLFSNFKVDPSNLDFIVFPGYLTPIEGITDYKKNRHKWFKIASKILPAQVLGSNFLTSIYLKKNKKKRQKLENYLIFFEQLNLDISKVKFVEHHLSHAATAYYLNWNLNPEKKILVLTLDGSGDGLGATVNIGYKNKLERIASIPSFHSLGILYSRMTSYLGMRPLEHEYKLMGMAPYAPDFLVEQSYKVLTKYYCLDDTGLAFRNTSGVWGDGMLKRFQRDLFMHRFDGICGGLQRITEELVTTWVKNWIVKTGINDIAVAGGVFMNVKLNMLLNELPEINSIFFMPSCGDESIALGAALQTYVENSNTAINIEPLKTLYLGPEYSDNDIEAILKKSKGFTYTKYDDINTKVADLLTKNKIIARMVGRMEFGARSLGNRAIVAHPQNFSTVHKINRAIKMRDFWMPFAPSILATAADKYLHSRRKEKNAPFMILGFHSTECAQKEIMAGLHQSDFTCRPQMVKQEDNPEYFDLLSKFEKATGISGVLNTSFNIHGYPIVNTPEDALWTLKESGLDALQMGSFLVEKAK